MQLSASYLSRCGVIQGPLIHPSAHHPLIHHPTPPIHPTLTSNRNVQVNIFWHLIREAFGVVPRQARKTDLPHLLLQQGKAGRLELSSLCKCCFPREKWSEASSDQPDVFDGSSIALLYYGWERILLTESISIHKFQRGSTRHSATPCSQPAKTNLLPGG